MTWSQRIFFCEIVVLLALFLFVVCQGNVSASIYIEDEKVDWDRFYTLVKEDKLPLLSKEEEDKILNETDRILREEKSIYLATQYMREKVGEKGKYHYIVYGNPKIKEKLVQLMKMKIQCEIKKELQSNYHEKAIKENKDLNEEEKQKALRKLEESKQKEMKFFEYLISIDGDLCPDCYLHDKGESKELTCPPGVPENEFEPEGFYWSMEAFYSIVLSTFPDNIYDYLWDFTPGNHLPDYIRYVNIAKTYPEKFLKDLETGYLREFFIYRQKGSYILLFDDFFGIVITMIKHNKKFVDENKKEIKSMMFNYLKDFEHYMENKYKEIVTGKEKFLTLDDTYQEPLKYKENFLEIYEQIGEKEDIENIKKLAENIPLDYPVREIHKEYDEKSKNEYLQRVKEFQERVNALIEKLSM